MANEHGDIGELLTDEQSELALKLRYGIGLEQLGADQVRRNEQYRVPPSPHVASREPDSGTYARAAALGVTAGPRGQWLRR